MTTQCEQILTHLKRGQTITTMQAFRIYEITRLPDRIRDLRAKGHQVYAEKLKLPSGKTCNQYSL